VPETNRPSPSQPGSPGRLPLLAGLATIGLLAAVTVLVFLCDPARPAAQPERWRWGSLAVLPFQPEPGSEGEAWIGEMLTRAVERGVREQRGVSAQLLAQAELQRAREDEPPGLAPALRATRLGRLTATPWIVTGTFTLHQPDAQILAAVAIIRARDGRQVGSFTRVGYLGDPEALGQAVAE